MNSEINEKLRETKDRRDRGAGQRQRRGVVVEIDKNRIEIHKSLENVKNKDRNLKLRETKKGKREREAG